MNFLIEFFLVLNNSLTIKFSSLNPKPQGFDIYYLMLILCDFLNFNKNYHIIESCRKIAIVYRGYENLKIRPPICFLLLNSSLYSITYLFSNT